ncbi:MAG: fibronectin type III domain-containing protein [Prolixibacteraceae bacterium]|nr:fibronectin type III domain-containing protein [Prolixibacteraceae bacterium]
MVKYFLSLVLGLLALTLNAQQLAFPGAEGFGRFATGGRGGTVVHVTNLNDSGAGSFRDAVSQPNRIVVFDVAGIIHINSRIVFAKNLTIAGQTAPGEGIVVYGDGVSFSGADNMICRYMRFRMGAGGTSGKDAAGIANGKNMIFDHVSVTWGRDETFSISWDNKGTEPTNITIQNSIIGQGLMTHSCGGLVQTSGGVTLFRNLYIDNHTRNPKVKGLNQFVNNVVYNWGGGGGYILGDSEGTSWATIVNNYFIKGPGTTVSTYSRANNNFQLYASGNYEDGNRDGSLNGVLNVKNDYGPAFWVEDPQYWADVPAGDAKKIPQMHPGIEEMTSAEEAYHWIVENVGAILPARDQVDRLMIAELTSLGTAGEIISHENELATNGPGEIFSGDKLPDTDNDGMPDVWEDANGTNKGINDAAVIGADGYSNIERYINGISEPISFLKNPVNIRATAKTTSSITLSWENSEEDLTGIVIQYGLNELFHESKIVEGTATSAVIDNLESNSKYYFRLKSVRGEQESPYSDIYTVVTNGEVIPPKPSENPTPANGQVIDNNKHIVLSWENRTGIMAGTLYFDIFLGTSENNMDKIIEATTLYSYTIDELREHTTYYWRVQTTNLLGVDEGVTWSFSTGEPIVRKMLLHFPFDESAGDVATDLTREAQGLAVNFTPSWEEGINEGAIFFPGTPDDSRLEVDFFDGLLIDDQSFTLSLWFKSQGGIYNSYLVHKGTHDSENGGTGRWYGIEYKGSTLTFGIDDNKTKTTANIDNANRWFDDTWHHIACMRDVENSLLKVYIDGNLQKEVADATGAIGETGKLIVGNRNVYFDNPFGGLIDDLRIYEAALNAYEIEDIFADTTSAGPNTVKKFMNQDVSIIPNPFNNELTVYFPNEFDKAANIKILSTSGLEVFSLAITTSGNYFTLNNLGVIPRGIYFCIVTGEGLYAVHKLVK